jgi:hypothetical protein
VVGFADGSQARWQGANDEHTRGGVYGASNTASGPASRSPPGRGGGRASALLRHLDDGLGITCVGAPRICPPGTRAEVDHFFRDRA